MSGFWVLIGRFPGLVVGRFVVFVLTPGSFTQIAHEGDSSWIRIGVGDVSTDGPRRQAAIWSEVNRESKAMD